MGLDDGPYKELWDVELVYAHTNFGSSISCQRSLLEVASLHLTNQERRYFLESEGSRFADRDSLYRALRLPYSVCPCIPSGIGSVAAKILFFKETQVGSIIQIELLFKLISADPLAFCNLLK